MNRLLRTDLFDRFLLSEATIKGKGSYVIDGHLAADFYTPEELEELSLTELSCLPFSMLRESCFAIIKGKKAPTYFKFVFRLADTPLQQTIAVSKSGISSRDLSGVFFNIKFQNDILTCTSGVSYRTFVPDHTFEHEWDQLLCRFFTQHDISYTVLS